LTLGIASTDVNSVMCNMREFALFLANVALEGWVRFAAQMDAIRHDLRLGYISGRVESGGAR
jgi:hypothetical protein